MRNVSRNDAPSANDALSGSGRMAVVVDRDALGVPAAGEERDDAPAVLGLARHLDAGDRRQLGRLRVVPLPHEQVEKVDSRGTNMQQGLSLGHVRIRHVLEGQLLGPPCLLDDDGFHEGLRTICVQRADASRVPSASWSEAAQNIARRDW